MNLTGPIDLIRKSFEIFFKKENLIYFLKIYVFLIPFTLINLFQDNFVSSQIKNVDDPAQLGKYMFLILPGLAIGLAGLIISFWVAATGILAIDVVIVGKKMSVKKTFLTSWKLLLRFSILNLVIGLIVGLGFILLIIPGIVFWVWFFFSGFELLTNGSGIRESLGKSRRLVKGKFWKVLGRLLVFGLFAGVVGAIISIFPHIGPIIVTVFGALFVLPSFLLYRELASGDNS